MKAKTWMMAVLFGAGWLSVEAQTLYIGNYADYEEESEDDSELFEGSAGDDVPVSFEYRYGGSQVIYTKEELADMAGKAITGISFPCYIQEYYYSWETDVKVYISEVKSASFEAEGTTTKWFNVKPFAPVCTGTANYDFSDYWYYANNHEFEFVLDKPYVYSGDNNLVLTFVSTCESDEYPSKFEVDFHTAGLKKRAIAYADSKKGMEEGLLSDARIANVQYNTSYSTRTGLDAPVVKFTYEDASPVENYFTMVTDCNTDFKEVSGVEAAYVVKEVGNVATLEDISADVVPANTPVVVLAKVNPSFTTAASAPVSIDGNLLKVSDGTVTGGENVYALALIDGVWGFYKVAASVTIPAGKAYLEIDAAAKEFLAIGDDGSIGKDGEATDDPTDEDGDGDYCEPTAVREVSVAASVQDVVYYTLSGQRVTNPQKGIYISNGRKVVRK